MFTFHAAIKDLAEHIRQRYAVSTWLFYVQHVRFGKHHS